MDRSGLCALALVTLAGACSEPSSDGPAMPAPSSRETASPAGVESSEPVLVGAFGMRGPMYLTWVQRSAEGTNGLFLSRFDGSAWSDPQAVVTSARLFLNWADLPSVAPGPDGSLWAHWLEREEGGGYGVRLARSEDGGASWSEPWRPHEDDSAAEHGFVAAVPLADGLGFAWLDGRELAAQPGNRQAATALRFRVMGPNGPTMPESVIDARACDCCQTDAAITDRGPVLAYRDRSAEEIRDIHVTSWRDGSWSEPRLVHEDGWQTGACPINGPAIDAQGSHAVVAWFTAAEGIPRVRVAFSDDSAARFGDPVIVDDGDPAGRVDAVLLPDGSALVSWLERTEGDRSDVRVRRVAPGGSVSESARISASGERVSGVPRMARWSADSVAVAWTDASAMAPRVRVAWIEAFGAGAP